MIGKKSQWVNKPSEQGKIKLQKCQFRTAPKMMSGWCFVVGCRYQQWKLNNQEWGRYEIQEWWCISWWQTTWGFSETVKWFMVAHVCHVMWQNLWTPIFGGWSLRESCQPSTWQWEGKKSFGTMQVVNRDPTIMGSYGVHIYNELSMAMFNCYFDITKG